MPGARGGWALCGVTGARDTGGAMGWTGTATRMTPAAAAATFPTLEAEGAFREPVPEGAMGSLRPRGA
jgi:hypothetical protein